MNKLHNNGSPGLFAPWPFFGDEEVDAVIRVLRSGKVNQWTGNEVYEFEKEYASYLGVKYVVALANGSVALDLALTVLGIGPGDEVIVTCRTFVASASCIALRGAIPVFADVDPVSQNITIDTVENVWTPRTKAVIAVHLAGWPCELDQIREFCDRKGIYLIEDCAQAHGARFKNRPVGSFGDIATFSFCQDKILTTGGEGGLLVTDNKEFWQRAWSFKDHGKDYIAMAQENHFQGFRWVVKSFGTNYRMTEMQAAIGRVVLKKLDKWVVTRRRFADILNEGFNSLPALRVTQPPEHIFHSYYKYYTFIYSEGLKKDWSRDRIVQVLSDVGIPCFSAGICPEVYLEEAFVNLMRKELKNRSEIDTKKGICEGRLPIAKNLGETSITFLVHPTLSDQNIYYIVEQMRKVLKEASR